jgi:hypothetical protein
MDLSSAARSSRARAAGRLQGASPKAPRTRAKRSASHSLGLASIMCRQSLSGQSVELARLDIAFDLTIPGVGVVVREPLPKRCKLPLREFRNLVLERLNSGHGSMIPSSQSCSVSRASTDLPWPNGLVLSGARERVCCSDLLGAARMSSPFRQSRPYAPNPPALSRPTVTSRRRRGDAEAAANATRTAPAERTHAAYHAPAQT